jgi:hypothetical protein
LKKSVENTRVGWGFWLQWVLASIVGVTIGQVISEIFILGFELYVIQGLSVGLLQWLVFRSRVSTSGWWILTTTIGFGFGFMVSHWPPDLTYFQYVLAWAIAGFIQWLFLRENVSHAGWWIPATTLALSIAVIANFMGLQWKFPFEIVNSLGLEGIRQVGNSFKVTANSLAGQALPLVRMGIRLVLWYLAEAFMGIVLTLQLRYFSKKQIVG